MTAPRETLLAGRYRLDDRIGAGAMGEVWRAHDLRLMRDVAVKRVRLGGHLDPAAEARFRREAVAMAGVSHPNVVSVYDAGTDTTDEGETAYLVMELLQGPSCSEVIAAGTAPDIAEIERIGAGVARGLAAAHAAGVVHRDIKPGNVVLNRGVPTIVDFGIARLEQETTATLTAPQTTIGTAAYMSPEQALGGHVGPASDVYSLGALLMALATGSPPFGATNSLSLMRAHIDDPPPSLAALRGDAPATLVALVERMLAKEPSRRPTAAEVAAILEGTHPMPTAVLDTVPAAAAGVAADASSRTTQVQVPPPATRPAVPAVPTPRAASQTRAPRRTAVIAGLLALLVLGVAGVIAMDLLGTDGSAAADDGRTGTAQTPATTPTDGPTERIVSPAPSPSLSTVSPAPISTDTPAPQTSAQTLDDAVAAAGATIDAVADPEARDELSREWQSASNGLQGANAEKHLREVIESAEDLSDDGAVTPAELDAIGSAVEQVIALLP